MATPQEIRRMRLATDYKLLCSIQGDIISWVPIKGEPPYVEEYRITVNVRTIIGASGDVPVYRDTSVMTISLPPDYPRQAPKIIMESVPPPFHTDWYTNGRWSYGRWFVSESLGDFVIRMVKSLQFDPSSVCEHAPSNYDAARWYIANKTSGLFPCDRQELPVPTGPRPAASGQSALIIKRRG